MIQPRSARIAEGKFPLKNMCPDITENVPTAEGQFLDTNSSAEAAELI